MFGLQEDSKSAEREDFFLVPLLEDDPVKTEPLDEEIKTEREIKTEVKTDEIFCEKWFQCEDCGKGFGTKQNLEKNRQNNFFD